jgi:hypothetical protein
MKHVRARQSYIVTVHRLVVPHRAVTVPLLSYQRRQRKPSELHHHDI